MVEKTFINVGEVKPTTVRPFGASQLRHLVPVFRDAAVCGSTVLDEIPPVVLIKDPTTGENVLYDGNHRCTLAAIYGILTLPAIIAEIGDILVLEGYEFRVLPRDLSLSKEFGERAKNAGYGSFDAFAQFASGNRRTQSS